MNDYPVAFTGPEPLPLDGLGPAGQAAARALSDKGYEVHIGLDEHYAEEIVKMAQEPAIKEYCPNDSGSRFASLEAAGTWLSKRRGVFLLIQDDNGAPQLVGYGWAGPESSPKVPGAQTTVALRIGQAAQGQGLATPFTKLILDGAALVYGARDFWLETWGSNGGAVKVYHNLGFIDVASVSSLRPSATGQVADQRKYMSLPNDKLLD